MKKIISIGLLISSLLLTSCDIEVREIDEESILEPTYNENMEEISEVIRSKNIEGFNLVMKYNTIDYDLNKWNILDNKTILVEAWTEGLPDNWEVIIEHVHIDMFVTSLYSNKPVLLQDQMDDKFHGFSQDGFVINDNVSYQNIFSIIGVNNDFAKSFYNDGTARYMRSSDLRMDKYYLNTMQIVYDVMIKKPGTDFYETFAIYDEIHIQDSSYFEDFEL